MQAKHAGSHGNSTVRAATTRHHDTDKSVKILTNPHTYQDYNVKTRKGGGSGSTKALI